MIAGSTNFHKLDTVIEYGVKDW